MFDQSISFHARLRPKSLAFVSDAGEISYESMDADVDRVASRLMAQGWRPGTDIVAVRAGSLYLQWLVLLALARLGIASAPATPAMPATALVSDVSDPAPQVLLDDGWIRETLGVPRRAVSRTLPPPSATARLMPSSGTTGQPKRMIYSWSWIDAAAKDNLLVSSPAPIRSLIMTGTDTVLGFVYPISVWMSGGALLATPPLPTLPQALATLRPNVIAMATGQLAAIAPLLPPDLPPLPGLVLTVGGGALPPALARRVSERLACELRMVYGSTETGLVVLGPATLLERVPDASGYTVPLAQVSAVDDAGQPVPPGTPGRLRIRSQHVVSGYEGEPAASAAAFQDGWFFPGDIGIVEADGLVRVLGRVDDVMNVGGMKFLPSALENPVLACTGVLEAAAFSVPDATSGADRAHIAIVRGEGFNQVAAAQASATAVAIPPPTLVWVDALPKNAMGKPDRAKLRAMVQAATGQNR